jgi:hypothetical protein
MLVDTGNNPISGISNAHDFHLDEPHNSVWRFNYGFGDGNWYYYIDTTRTHVARWAPNITRAGRYQVSVKYRADNESCSVTYVDYDYQRQELGRDTVNQYSSRAEWAYKIISESVYFDNGASVLATDIPAGTNIDVVKFQYKEIKVLYTKGSLLLLIQMGGLVFTYLLFILSKGIITMNKIHTTVVFSVFLLIIFIICNDKFNTNDERKVASDKVALSSNSSHDKENIDNVDGNIYVENKNDLADDFSIKHNLPSKKGTSIVKDIYELDMNKLIIDVLNGNSNSGSALINNMSEVLACNECIDNLKQLLTSIALNEELYNEIVLSIVKVGNKESAELLLQSIYKNNELGNKKNIEAFQNLLAEFDSTEAMEVFAQAIFSNVYDTSYIQQLSGDMQYAIEKVITNTSDRDYVASTLSRLYENALDEKIENRIVALDHPEMYAATAIEAYGQGNSDLYNTMLENLTKTNNRQAINGLMTLSRKMGENSLGDVLKVANQWASRNSSTKIISIAEDYLSNPESTPEERIIAAALISNTTEKEKILGKALQYEEDENVNHYINQYRYAN